MPAAGSNPSWAFEDFFSVDVGQQERLKLALALHLDIRFANVNTNKVFSHSVDGIAPYTTEEVDKQLTACMNQLRSGAPVASATWSTVLNGCQVRWPAPGRHVNKGYIKCWAEANISKWDVSVERRAGGLDPRLDYAAQAFEMTNISSLYAMLATVVRQFLVDGEISGTMKTAFTSVRTCSS